MTKVHRAMVAMARKRVRKAETTMRIAHHDWDRAFEDLRSARRQLDLLQLGLRKSLLPSPGKK